MSLVEWIMFRIHVQDLQQLGYYAIDRFFHSFIYLLVWIICSYYFFRVGRNDDDCLNRKGRWTKQNCQSTLSGFSFVTKNMKNKSIEMTSFIHHHHHRHTFFIDYEIKLSFDWIFAFTYCVFHHDNFIFINRKKRRRKFWLSLPFCFVLFRLMAKCKKIKIQSKKERERKWKKFIGIQTIVRRKKKKRIQNRNFI